MTFDTSASEIIVTILSGHGVSDDDGDGVIVLYDITGNDDYLFWVEAPAVTYGT